MENKIVRYSKEWKEQQLEQIERNKELLEIVSKMAKGDVKSDRWIAHLSCSFIRDNLNEMKLMLERLD